MMKKYLLPFFLFIFVSCSVNEQNGVIIVNNYTEDVITNLKFGDIYLSFSINSGAKVEYWVSSQQTGSISSDNAGFYSSTYDLPGYNGVYIDGDFVKYSDSEFIVSPGCYLIIDIKPYKGNNTIFISSEKIGDDVSEGKYSQSDWVKK